MSDDATPYAPEELELLRTGANYRTRQNARWFATLAALQARLASRAEEVRSACAQAAAHWARESGLAYGEPSHLFDAVMAVPLDSTPLADEMRDEREVGDSLRTQLIAAEARVAEALNALEKLQAAQKHVLEVMCAGEDAYMAAFDGAEAVLAKAAMTPPGMTPALPAAHAHGTGGEVDGG